MDTQASTLLRRAPRAGDETQERLREGSHAERGNQEKPVQFFYSLGSVDTQEKNKCE